MTVGIIMLPDGMWRLPPLALDDSYVAQLLKNSGYANWQETARTVSGSMAYLELSIGDENATLDDFNKSGLESASQALVDGLAVKEHPQGWHTVEDYGGLGQ